jgi:hypothetical protein
MSTRHRMCSISREGWLWHSMHHGFYIIPSVPKGPGRSDISWNVTGLLGSQSHLKMTTVSECRTLINEFGDSKFSKLLETNTKPQNLHSISQTRIWSNTSLIIKLQIHRWYHTSSVWLMLSLASSDPPPAAWDMNTLYVSDCDRKGTSSNASKPKMMNSKSFCISRYGYQVKQMAKLECVQQGICWCIPCPGTPKG